MTAIKTVRELKQFFQDGFERNEASLERFGVTYSKQLKAYLVENSNVEPDQVGAPAGGWRRLDSPGWYASEETGSPSTFFLDASAGRVWKVYSVRDATESDTLLERWLGRSRGLDSCWLSRAHLLHWRDAQDWSPRGIGLRFRDGLAPEDDASNFSLKAWHGSHTVLRGLNELLEKGKEELAIHSARWQKRSNGSVVLSSEWYSDGKVTIGRATDVDEVLHSITEMAIRYSNALDEATKMRDTKLGAFEIDFTQSIDLGAFSAVVAGGTGEMRLWLLESESQPDFKRFKGVDLHTWNRILLDVGPDYAYLTVPRSGCVNAVPRIATIQGEDNAGRTSIYYDGVEVFA